MSIKIEQVAIGVRKGSKEMVQNIIDLLGATNWILDTVKFSGKVFGEETKSTEAILNFNYDLIPGIEFEILEYTDGDNWHKHRAIGENIFLSHLGLHVDSFEELACIRKRLMKAGINVAQESHTYSHENVNVPEGRSYYYLIFDSIDVLGFDLKIIHRRDK